MRNCNAELINATQLLLSDFADKVDLQLQRFDCGYMYKYTELSAALRKATASLPSGNGTEKYNEHLEELVDAKVGDIRRPDCHHLRPRKAGESRDATQEPI